MTPTRSAARRTFIEDHRWLLLFFGARNPWLVLGFAVPLGALLLALAGGWARREGPASIAAHVALGVLYWTFVEYAIHRWFYHWRPRSAAIRRIVQSFHVYHHRDIADRAFWNAGPALALPIAGLLALPLLAVFRATGPTAMTLFGAVLGYYAYEWFHFTVHARPHLGGFLGRMQRFHLHHHHRDPRACFGVSNPFWDMVFGTAAALVLALAVPAEARAEAAPAPLLAPEVWAALPRPSDESLARLAARIPGLDGTQVREMTLERTRALLALAAERGLSAIDLFTDPGLRGREIYFIPGAVLAAIDAEFALGALFPISGKTTAGEPFAMEAIVMGAGRNDMLYDRDEFTFKHAVYTSFGGRYTLRARVGQRIEAAGVLAVEGVVGPLDVTIRRFTKGTEGTVDVETSFIDQTDKLYPIRRR